MGGGGGSDILIFKAVIRVPISVKRSYRYRHYLCNRVACSVIQDGLKFTHQLLVYDDVNILGGSIYTYYKNNTEALLVACKEIGLEINADKTKYTVMSREQNAGRSHNIKTDNSSFERAEHFKYLGTILTKQNSVREEIKSRLKTVTIIRCRIFCLPVSYPKI